MALLLIATTGGVMWISSQPFIEENQNLILELNSQSSVTTGGQVQDYFESEVNRLALLGRELFMRTKLDADSGFLAVSLASPEVQSGFRVEKQLITAQLGQIDESAWLSRAKSYLDQASKGTPQVFPVQLREARWGIGLAIPYLEENREVRGRVLAGILNPEQVLDLIGESEHGSKFLVNSQGLLLVQSGGVDIPLGSDLSGRDSVRAFLGRKFNNGQSRGLEELSKRPILSSFRTIGKMGLGLVTEVPESTVFGAVKKVQYRTGLVAIIIFCLAFVIGTFYSETITEPISELVRATEVVKKGHFDVQVKRSGRDELAKLSDAFVLMAAELKVQQEALVNQEKLVVAGRMARNIGHEFGNILQPLLTKLDLLQEFLQESSLDEQVKKVQEMIEIAGLGAGICQGLMTLSKETKETTVKAPFRLAEAAEKGVRLLSHELKRKDVKVEISIPEELEIFGSESQIMQVLINLAVNSTHAMGDGGRLALRAEGIEGHIRLEVSDNGSGILPENLNKIFEPLFSTKGAKGNGLGLSISRSIIESHGGSIKVESKLGEGTTMIMEFPNATSSQAVA